MSTTHDSSFVNDPRAVDDGGAARLTAILDQILAVGHALSDWFTRRRIFTSVMGELERLDDRSLADVGFRREALGEQVSIALMWTKKD
jgi:uncharacterized protein YjiS (DUF1127 family)